MQLTKLKIKNYKSIRNLDQDLRGNVFVVIGDNDKGKSTFAKAFLKLVTKPDKPEEPVTRGEKEGQIRGEFINANGEKYTVILDFTNDKESIKMVAPDGISTTKVNEIRSLFDYNYVDVEEFISWSTTAEGRRKQREAVLKLLPKENLDEFLKWEKIEKQQYDLRTVANSTVKALQVIAEKSIPTEEEDAVWVKQEAYKEDLTALKNKKEDSQGNLILLEKVKGLHRLEDANYTNLFASKNATKESYEEDKKLTDERIIELQKEIARLNEKSRNLDEGYKSYSVDIEVKLGKSLDAIQAYEKEINEFSSIVDEDLDKKLEAAQKLVNSANDVVNKREQHKLQLVELDEATKKSDELTDHLDIARANKQNAIISGKIPIPGLSIDDDGIKLNDLPFTREQLSTSEIMFVVFNILVALNKKTPIIYLGRAESLGPDKLQLIIDEALKNKCQIFIDKVVGGAGLQIEIMEDVTSEKKPLI